MPAGTASGDFTNYTSYVSWPDNTPNPAPVEYNFSPRSGSNNELYVWVRARARGGVSTSMNVQVDNAAAKTIGCITDTAWTWYRYDACSQLPINLQNLTIQNHIFRITPGNDKLEIDKILLTTSATLILNSAPPSSGSASATVTASGNTTFCQGGSVTLTSSSGSSYQWLPGGQTTQSITVNASGSYYVNVGSGTGCAAVSNAVTVSVLQAPSSTITAGGSTTLCQGASVSLSAPAGAASYLWTPGNQTTQTITTSTAGSYSVRVTNTGGCSTTSAPVTVSVGNSPAANITANGPTAFCQGQNVTLTASSANAYLWFPGGQTTQSITVSSANSYSVRVTGSGGCTAMSAPTAVTISAAPTATITAGGSTVICNGGSVSLTASAGASYLWTPGAFTTQSINVSNAGAYTVRVTNSTGCSATSSPTNITISTPPTATITAGGATSFCTGSSVTLTATAAAAYLWSPGGQTTQSISASTTGAYSVRVTNAGGCTATSANTNVNVIAAPNAAIAPSGPTNFCTGGSVTLTSSGGASYLWSPGGQTSQSINVTSSGAYSVRVTNSSGCSKVSPVTNVSVNSSPIATISASGSTNLCQGESVVLSASNGSNYLWSNGQTSQSINVSTPGSYLVTVSSGTGCSATSAPQTVTVSAAVNASISANGPTALSPGQNVMLTATGGASYLWSPGGQTTASIIVSTAGTYSATAFNASGCSNTSSPIIVTEIPISGPPASISSNGGTAICPGETIVLTANNGSAYVWSPGGQTTQSISVTSGGNYSVVVTSISGTGASTADIDITVSPVPAAPAILSTYIPNSSFQLQAYEPTAHSYLWANGSTSQTITINNTGTYTVRAINGLGCISSPESMVVTSMASLPCGNPNMLSHYSITKTEAIVSWNPAVTADSFRVNYTRISTQVTETIYVRGNISNVKLKNLAEGEAYKWTVYSICGSNQTGSNFRQFTTLTGPLPCGSTPQYLQTYNINSTFAKLSWFDTQADKFVIRYRAVGTSAYQYRRSYTSLTQAMIQGLTPSTTYEWSVRSMCDANVSLYSTPLFFTTLSACPSIGNVTVSELGFNKARLSWNASIVVDTIMVRYALSGTTDYKIVKIAGNPGNYFVLGLLAQTTYDAWVATKCSSGSTSMWGTGVTFTTFNEPNSRNTPEAGLLHLNAYPNPTKYQIGFVFDAKEEAPYTVKVCDMAGKELLAETRVSTDGKNGDEVSLAGFASGMYMLVVQQGPMIGRFKFNISE
ncbi:MAG: T9SS type A sorting domain-containing protein [Bacteroidetes bacterium]|nr:T9SS type A sorting domain-containing protein [Bacteroidota bacterium]